MNVTIANRKSDKGLIGLTALLVRIKTLQLYVVYLKGYL